MFTFQIKNSLPEDEKKIFIWCDKKDFQAFLDDGWRAPLYKKNIDDGYDTTFYTKHFNDDENEYILLYKMEDNNEK